MSQKQRHKCHRPAGVFHVGTNLTCRRVQIAHTNNKARTQDKSSRLL